MCGALVLVARATVTLFVSPVEDWNVDCGYEEALHSNVEDWNVDCGYEEALHSNVEDWNENCGYEEALHSNGEVLVLPEKGDQIGQGIKCQLVKDC